MPPSWMIKLKEGWGEAKKDSEGEDDGLKKEEGEIVWLKSCSVLLMHENFEHGPVLQWQEQVNSGFFQQLLFPPERDRLL